MSTEPENPIPDPQPAEPRPLAGDGNPAGVESDLWELDEEGASAPSSQAAEARAKTDDQRRVDVRNWLNESVQKHPATKKENRKRTGVQLDIQPKSTPRLMEKAALPRRRVEQEFEQLDTWDDSVPMGEVDVDPLAESAAVVVEPDPSPAPESDHSDPVNVEVLEEAMAEEQPLSSEAECPKPMASGRKSSATPMRGMEWAGLIVLGLLLIALAAGAYFWSIHRLPHKAPPWKQVSFPVKGQLVEIKDAKTYWRAPVLEGPKRDPIRRGTRLIPILELEVVGGPAALRVIFRDDEGRSVGDPIIHPVAASGKFALASTAGFEDLGMHAAYRTEELDPWSVEVSEAASADASGNDFSLILKMNLSSDLR